MFSLAVLAVAIQMTAPILLCAIGALQRSSRAWPDLAFR